MNESESNNRGSSGPPPGQQRPPVDPSGVLTPPAPPPPYVLPPYYPTGQGSQRGGWWTRIATGFFSSLLIFSLLLNVYFVVMLVSMAQGPRESVYLEGDKYRRIVILPITGVIDSDTAKFVHDALAKLKTDLPKALILRVNSGGGGVSASDQIWHELTAFKEEHKVPLVASFGSIAASGGYYISMPADFIVAEPTTITGSIGVIAQAFTVHELLQKIGVKPEIITATDAVKKDKLNPMQPWTDEDRNTLRGILDEAQVRFVDIVDRGRPKLDLDQTKKLATGEVFTCRQAQENKLVDSQGYLEAAIDKAKELAGIGPEVEPLVTQLSPSKGFGLLSALETSVPRDQWGSGVSAQQVRRWVDELSTPVLQYRWSQAVGD